MFPFDADRAAPPGEGRPLTDEDAAVQRRQRERRRLVGLLRRRTARARGHPWGPGERRHRRDDGAGRRGGAGASFPRRTAAASAICCWRPPGAPLSPDLDYALAWRGADGHERLLTPWERVVLYPDRRSPRRSGCPRDAADSGLWRTGPARRGVCRTGGRAAPRAARRRSEAVLAGPLFPRRAPGRLRRRQPRGRWSDRARDRAVRQQQLVSMDADRRRSRLARQAPMVARRRHALLSVARGRGLLRPVGRPDRSRPRCAGRSLHSGSRSSIRRGSTSIPTGTPARWASPGDAWSCRCRPSRAASGSCRTLVLEYQRRRQRVLPISHLRGIEVIRHSAQVRRHVPRHFCPPRQPGRQPAGGRRRLVGRPDRQRTRRAHARTRPGAAAAARDRPSA